MKLASAPTILANSRDHQQGILMRLLKTIQRKLFGGMPTYDGVGGGRRSLAWTVGNPGAVAALLFSQNELRAKSRDLVRRNAWASAALEAFEGG